MPLGWKPAKHARRYVDAKLSEKYGDTHFAYKLNASVDKRCKLIRNIALTQALWRTCLSRGSARSEQY